MHFRLLLLYLFVFTLYYSNLPAQASGDDPAFDADRYEGLEYRFVGPTRGGRSTAVAGIAQQPHTFLMGTTGGGVWRTDDAGNSWRNISDGQIGAGSIGAIGVAPSDPNVLYLGTGSACPRGNVSPGVGMYGSTDGGDNWRFLGLPRAGQIGAVVVHPNHPELVYVAALGQIFGKNPERGVYRSRDGGDNWEQVLAISDSTGVVDLAMNPDNPRILYAAAWRAERKPWTLIDGGPEGGVYKTTDGGDEWEKLGGGLPTGLLGRIGLAVSPAKPDRVWAQIQAKAEEDGGLYRSDDGGRSWKRVNRNHKLRQRGWYYSHLTAHPTEANTLFASNTGFYRSTDGGKTFDRIPTPHGDNHGVWINPEHPRIMINCNDGGANVTLNAGESWSTQLNQPTSEFYRLTVDQQFPYRLYAGQQDNTTISVPSHDPGSITRFQQWEAVGGGESADVAVHAQNPDIVYAGTYSGEITYYNRKTGAMRQVTAYPHYTEGTEMRDLKYRWQWNFPIVASAHEPGAIYMGSNYVHRSTDQGQTWTVISPDLSRNMDQYHDIPGGPIQHDATGVEVYSSIFALEESPHEAGVFWAGTDDGRLWMTRNGGDEWREITPEDMPYEGTVNKIELSAHRPGRAFVAVYNYRYNDFSPYLYRTDDFGESWQKVTAGIPEDQFVRSVAEDPAREGLVYAGAEFGLYVSFNSGEAWHPLQLNLPRTPITDMEVQKDDLILSTQGRGFWILDDLTPLQQHDAQVAQAEHHLYEPREAVRTNVSGHHARIHAYLAEAPEEAKLEILDKKGRAIRTYSTGTDNDRNKLRVKAGFNSWNWNLRHDGPELVEDLVTMVIRNPARGPYAVPGDYRVRLTFGDWSQTRALKVRKDPRWDDLTTEDLQSQLDLTLEIRDMITESHRRIRNLRALREQIKRTAELAVEAGHDTAIDSLARQIAAELTAVEEMIIQTKAEASQDNINYPRVFSNHIGRLYSVAANAHQRPTGGVLERYEDIKQEYAGIVREYERVLEEAVPRFNELLRREAVGRLIVPEKVE